SSARAPTRTFRITRCSSTRSSPTSSASRARSRRRSLERPREAASLGELPPLSLELAVPQLGEGLREVRIVEILRRAGDAVARGEPMYVVETDKSTVELEAPFDGTIEGW